MSLSRLLPKSIWWLIFLVVLTVWTIGLLIPDPSSSAVEGLGGARSKFLIAKTLHVSAYAFVTFLAGFVVWSRASAGWCLAFLVSHAFLTEWLQTFVGRSGSLRDVGLDLLGILIGVAMNWRCWSILRAQPHSQSGTDF